eukprot:7308841-Alexandrium_andersonii.AAC.1
MQPLLANREHLRPTRNTSATCDSYAGCAGCGVRILVSRHTMAHATNTSLNTSCTRGLRLRWAFATPFVHRNYAGSRATATLGSETW